MEHFDERPWVKKIEDIGPIKVWLVDPLWIRKYIEREFTNFAQPLNPTFKDKIPADEFWIAEGTQPSERGFFIDHMLREFNLQRRGYAFGRAEQMARDYEASQRGVADQDENAEYPEKVEVGIRSIGKAHDALGKLCNIVLVNSRKVRDAYKVRFCCGGNGAVYPFIPPDEIWVDNDLPKVDWDYNGIHELEEADRMFPMLAKGMSRREAYLKAHPIASRIEYQARWDQKKLSDLLLKWKIIEGAKG